MSVGATLALAREERGLSVEDVSAATRIRAGLIRSIEADDFTPCGGGVYARGHIRSLARAVGIDGEPLVAEFDQAHSEDAPVLTVPAPAIEPELAARAERRTPNWTAAMAVALIAICAVAAYGLARGNNNSNKPAAGKQPAPITTTQPTTAPPASPPASAEAQVPSDVAIALVRVVSDQTWLQVETLSGRLLFSGLLGAGETKLFRDAKGLRMVIGNAPVVDLVADNRDLGSPKSSGNVAHVTVQPGGDVQYA